MQPRVRDAARPASTVRVPPLSSWHSASCSETQTSPEAQLRTIDRRQTTMRRRKYHLLLPSSAGLPRSGTRIRICCLSSREREESGKKRKTPGRGRESKRKGGKQEGQTTPAQWSLYWTAEVLYRVLFHSCQPRPPVSMTRRGTASETRLWKTDEAWVQ